MRWIKPFAELGISDVPLVGGKNASLGEMLSTLGSLGVQVPDGFAVTAEAYWHHLRYNHIESGIAEQMHGVDTNDVDDLRARAEKARHLILSKPLPPDLVEEIELAARSFSDVAVRSSATAEDLPNASFAGQQESFLHVGVGPELQDTVRKCMASLFTTRAVSYREDMGFDHMKVGLSVGVQRMVDSGPSASGVMFTLDTESGFSNVVSISSIWGLGENIVQGRVIPDEFLVHKTTLKQGFRSILRRKLGSKEFRLIYDREAHRLKNERTPDTDRQRLSLSDDDAITLAGWAMTIEDHYDRPMDIEWAKDAGSGELFIVQARPETVHSQRGSEFKLYHLKSTGPVLVKGLAVGQAIGSGPARIITEPSQMADFQPGEVLLGPNTDPDWEPIMKKASAIVTEQGGRTSHAAIVARELGIPAVVGARGACSAIQPGQMITVACQGGADGFVYDGALDFEVESVDTSAVDQTRTELMVNLGDPDQAFRVAQLPCKGVGLVRMEFIFASWVKVHPLALTRYDTLTRDVQKEIDCLTSGYDSKLDYFVDKLSQGIAMIAGAFHPRPVILRFSDFKSNEYCNLLGGAGFEPHEENPMIGWRGASRYYHPDFREGFMLELEAVKKVRDEMGLTNLKVMIPFCRTPDEGRQVLETMSEGGLARGHNGLEVYVMAELPSNILQAEEFADLFDGFSIGSNDLTQLILGVDRDSSRVAPLFNERNPGVKRACAMVIEAAKKKGRKIGICGQAPSDFPDFAAFLVEQGIDSISLTPDALLPTALKLIEIEKQSLAHH